MLTLGIGGAVLISAMNNAWAPAVYRAAPAERGAVLDDSTHRDRPCWRPASPARWPSRGRGCCASSRRPGTGPTNWSPRLAVVTAATVLSVVYLASGHLVFASGRTTALALVTVTPR